MSQTRKLEVMERNQWISRKLRNLLSLSYWHYQEGKYFQVS